MESSKSSPCRHRLSNPVSPNFARDHSSVVRIGYPSVKSRLLLMRMRKRKQMQARMALSQEALVTKEQNQTGACVCGNAATKLILC